MDNQKIIKLSVLDYDQKIVIDLQTLITSKYEHMFLGVFVLGSIEEPETTKYSDFDGLLIIKDQYKGSRLLEKFIDDSMSIILDYDPFQHHGWFLIFEKEIQKHRESKLPYNLIKKSKCIYHQPNLSTLKFHISDYDYKKTFKIICENLEKNILSRTALFNLYELKGMLSQVMLLPSVYYAAVNKKMVLKKDSFELVKPCFSNFEWLSIDISTEIRKRWDYKLNFIQKFIMTKNIKLFRYLTKKIVSPPIPHDYQLLIDENFFQSLHSLISSMKENLKN